MTDDPVDEPPIEGAAEAPSVPIGKITRKPPGRTFAKPSPLVDILAIVVFPLFVPAVLLAIIRSGNGRSILDSVSINEVAFGVVAVGFAAIARAVTGHHKNWGAVAAAAAFVITCETAVAVFRDSFVPVEKLIDVAKECKPKSCNFTEVANMGIQLAQAHPAPAQWYFSLFLAFVISSAVIITVLSEG